MTRVAVLPLKYWRDGVVSLRAEIQPTAAQIDSGVLAIGDGPQARHSATSHRAIEPAIAGIGKATVLRLIGTLQASRSAPIPMLRLPLSRRELKGEKARAKSKSSGHYAQAEPPGLSLCIRSQRMSNRDSGRGTERLHATTGRKGTDPHRHQLPHVGYSGTTRDSPHRLTPRVVQEGPVLLETSARSRDVSPLWPPAVSSTDRSMTVQATAIRAYKLLLPPDQVIRPSGHPPSFPFLGRVQILNSPYAYRWDSRSPTLGRWE